MNMGSMVKALLGVFLMCLVSLSSVQAQAETTSESFPNQAAYDVVQVATDNLVEQITGKRLEYVENNELFFADVDGMLSAVIDFKRIARRVMAKHYKKAEPEQQLAFEGVFKRSLLKVYAKALLEYDNEKIIILPPSSSKKVNPKRQRVDIEFFSSGGQKFPISYSMYLNKQGEWKMENVVVNGVNIGLTYRNQFARLMKVNGNDVDLVVSGWTSDLENGE
jgi:phospholipid transport system substrate-binding protein